MRPDEHIEVALAGHAEVLRTARGLTESAMREPSLLPHWSRARVLAHLAHKSRSHADLFAGARIGEARVQYPEGQAAADAEVIEWSELSAEDLCRLLGDSFSALESAWEVLPGDAWTRRALSSAGERSMTEFVHRHMRDVFVHHVDLDVGYGPEDWPETFVRTELPKRLRALPDRADSRALLAWLFGRAPAPELGPW
jgi:maleylpyruvate isomerase